MAGVQTALIWTLATFAALAALAPAALGQPAPEPPGDDRLAPLEALIRERRFAEALQEGTLLLPEMEARLGPDSLPVARLLDLVVRAYWEDSQARAPRARELAERAIAIKQARLGPRDPDLALSIRNLGSLLFRSENPAAARPYFERALAIQEEVLPADDPVLAWTVNELANLLEELGDYPAALAMHERNLAIREKRHGPSSQPVASTLQNYGNVLFRSGDLIGAKQAYERCIQIHEKLNGPEAAGMSGVLIAYGFLMWQMGDLPRARSSLERSIAISEKALGPESLHVGEALSNLGILLMDSDLEAARAALDRSLAIREKHLGRNHPHVSISLHNLGVVARKQGDYQAARRYYERSLAITEQTLGPAHPNVAHNLSNIGNLLTLSGNHEEARKYYERSLDIFRDKVGSDHPDVAAGLENLAAVALAAGDRHESLRLASQAAEILNRNIRDVVAFLPERQAMLLLSAQTHPEGVLFDNLLSGPPDSQEAIRACWHWALERRGLVLEELARRNEAALGAGSPAAHEAWERVAAARRHLGELWVAGSSGDDADGHRAALAAAHAEKEKAEQELARLSLRIDSRRDRSSPGLADAHEALPSRSALVEIVRVLVGPPTDENRPLHDIALIQARDRPARFVDLGPSSALDELTVSWRLALDESASEISTGRSGTDLMAPIGETGTKLRRSAWDPIASILESGGGVDQVYLVPDGAYHQIDLGVLPAGNGSYLIEKGLRIRLLSSARDLLRPAVGQRIASGEGMLVLGAPDFDHAGSGPAPSPVGPTPGSGFRGQTPECSAFREMTWGPLPESGREARRVKTLLGRKEPVVLLTGPEASEGRLREMMPGKRLLHLATHGFFLQEQCGGSVGTATMVGTDQVNPLLLSGLVFAGANLLHDGAGSDEDGILTAEEMAAFDLGGVDLVVMSACDTGRGAIAAGEGVFGLRRALEIAGARSTVMSLWQVPDRQAIRWMTGFYRSLLSGDSIQDAAHHASLASLEALRRSGRPTHPYLWGGFQAFGNGNL